MLSGSARPSVMQPALKKNVLIQSRVLMPSFTEHSVGISEATTKEL